jgi:hypothetical protein
LIGPTIRDVIALRCPSGSLSLGVFGGAARLMIDALQGIDRNDKRLGAFPEPTGRARSNFI